MLKNDEIKKQHMIKMKKYKSIKKIAEKHQMPEGDLMDVLDVYRDFFKEEKDFIKEDNRLYISESGYYKLLMVLNDPYIWDILGKAIDFVINLKDNKSDLVVGYNA